ncbi:MAG: GNAT family N-acetyltransferase [Acidimicrobiaceae bacterium]|nr:GNAT family N-acetyltransferase [Acidimicrobiaceae bacterium]
MPQPVDSYIAFAHKLPSQFDDHAWLVETAHGAPVACGFCWSDSSGDTRVMECDVLVQRAHRRQGIGSRLFAAICDETRNEGRSLLMWSTFDAVGAGEAFSRRVGARVARVNRTSELVLAGVDRAMIEGWTAAERARDLGYRLEVVDGVIPEHLRGDAVIFHRIMQDAPRESLELADRTVNAQFIAELNQADVGANRERWTIFVRDARGVCVGGTEVTFEPGDEDTVVQQNTGIDPGHRGLGLAKWAKAAMLQRIQSQRPAARRIRTDNAFSNEPMLGINRALGFEVISTRTEWQVSVAGSPEARGRQLALGQARGDQGRRQGARLHQ